MFEGDRAPFDGVHYQLAEPINVPGPLSSPRPRIIVGGNGPHRTMDLIARYGDASNFLVPDPGESRRLVETIRSRCDELGRDPADIEITALFDTDLRPGRMTPADVVARARAQADEGVDHLIINLPDVHRTEQITRIGREVIPELVSLGAGAAV